MKFIFMIITLLSLSAFADNPIRWKCGPKLDVADAGFYITLSDPSRFPFAEVREMTIAGSKIIYKDYLYQVDRDNGKIHEYRDLYSNGRKLILVIDTSEKTDKGYSAVLNLEERELGQLGLLKCQMLD